MVDGTRRGKVDSVLICIVFYYICMVCQSLDIMYSLHIYYKEIMATTTGTPHTRNIFLIGPLNTYESTNVSIGLSRFGFIHQIYCKM